MALSRPFAAVTTPLTSCASGASCWAVGDAGSCSIVPATLETEDFSALVSFGKSCFAELTTALALLCTSWRPVCSVERASLSLSWMFLIVVDRLLEIADVRAVPRLVVLAAACAGESGDRQRGRDPR